MAGNIILHRQNVNVYQDSTWWMEQLVDGIQGDVYQLTYYHCILHLKPDYYDHY